jgi:hypothetical protein
MRDETWQILDDTFLRSPVLKAETVETAEVVAAEQDVGIPLPEDYKAFVCRYGGAVVGPFPIFGLRKATPMGRDQASFVDITKGFRRQRWPGVEKLAVISQDHSGNPVGIDSEGRVWISDHDHGALQVIADSFEDYLRKWCLQLPS